MLWITRDKGTGANKRIHFWRNHHPAWLKDTRRWAVGDGASWFVDHILDISTSQFRALCGLLLPTPGACIEIAGKLGIKRGTDHASD